MICVAGSQGFGGGTALPAWVHFGICVSIHCGCVNQVVSIRGPLSDGVSILGPSFITYWDRSDSDGCLTFSLSLCPVAIAIKESAHVGDKNAKRLAKGVDDLGKVVISSPNLSFIVTVQYSLTEFCA